MESFVNVLPIKCMEETCDETERCMTPFECTERCVPICRPHCVPRYEREWMNNVDVYPTKTMPKWFTVVDMDDFLPEKMVAKLNYERLVLVIKSRRITHQFQEKGDYKNVTERIICLPQNICFEKLEVCLTPRHEIIVTAPYLNQVCHGKNVFHHRTPLCRETTIPITYKLLTGYKPHRCYDEKTNELTMLKHKMPMLDEIEFNNLREFDIIRDEITGLKKVQFEVNTIGFCKEDILVKIDETERLVVVETKKEEILRVGVIPKYLRRAFTLPRGLNLKQTVVRLSNRGTLLIQVPFLLEEPCCCRMYRDAEEEKMWLKPRWI